MKGNQNYFDENFEKEAESNLLIQNQAKQNNIKISLDPKENLHNADEDLSNNTFNERENAKQSNKSYANTKKSKIIAKSLDSLTAPEQIKTKSSNMKSSINHSFKNEIGENYNDYEVNDIQMIQQADKKKNAKSKKSSSNKFSNGILEEVGNSKFIIRTNLLDDNDDIQDDQKQENEQSKEEYYDDGINHKGNESNFKHKHIKNQLEAVSKKKKTVIKLKINKIQINN